MDTTMLHVAISKANFLFIKFLHLTNDHFVFLFRRLRCEIPVLLKQSDSSKHTSSTANFNSKF